MRFNLQERSSGIEEERYSGGENRDHLPLIFDVAFALLLLPEAS